jgi:hypothetical protein
MSLTPAQREAIARARERLEKSRGPAPEGISGEQAHAYWRGYLGETLAALLDGLGEGAPEREGQS